MAVKKHKITTLKKKLDGVFSKFIRQRDKGQCYTCPHKDDWKYMQNGHFVPRQYLITRWDEKNCHCQCMACNMFYNGQPQTYAKNLIRDYGANIINELEALKWMTVKLDSSYYLTMIDKYTKLLK